MTIKQFPVIAVDGPSGVGKGTLCVSLAKYLKWHLLDSGAIYRVLALSVLDNHISVDNEQSIAQHALSLPLTFETTDSGVMVLLDNKDVSKAIRQQEIADTASKIAVLHKVRDALLTRQRDFRMAPGLVADGRDMGTVVFQDAFVKVFLDASAEARAERRMKQLQEKGICVKFGEILHEVTERDERDRNRAVAPLRAATDAVIIDSTLMTIEDVFNQVLALVNDRIK